MTRRAIIITALAIPLLLHGSGCAQSRTMVNQRDALAQATTDQAAARSNALLKAWREGTINEALENIAADVEGGPERDRALYDLVRAIGDTDDNAQDRQTLERIRTIEPTAWVPLEECRETVPAPLFDYPTDAERILLQRHRADSFRAIAAALQQWSTTSDQSLLQWIDQQISTQGEENMLSFLRTLDAEALAGIDTAKLQSELRSMDLSSPAATQLAIEIGDEEIRERTILEGHPATLLQLFQPEVVRTSPTARRDIAIAMHHPKFRNIAITALGELTEDPAVREELLSMLGHPSDGGHAALAISNAHSDVLDQEVEQLFATTTDYGVLRRGIILVNLREDDPPTWRAALLANPALTDQFRALLEP